jgi:hypothetical protein
VNFSGTVGILASIELHSGGEYRTTNMPEHLVPAVKQLVDCLQSLEPTIATSSQHCQSTMTLS